MRRHGGGWTVRHPAAAGHWCTSRRGRKNAGAGGTIPRHGRGGRDEGEGRGRGEGEGEGGIPPRREGGRAEAAEAEALLGGEEGEAATRGGGPPARAPRLPP